MKSIIEESSSIAKAIENAWERAGNPQEFSVKVFQAPEKNFFGFTKIAAKVGIFFSPQPQQQSLPHTQPKRAKIESSAVTTAVPAEQKKDIRKEHPMQAEICKKATVWLGELLELAGLSHIAFTVKMQRNNIVVSFLDSLSDNPNSEKKIFANMSYLLLCTLRNELNSDLKDIKILLKRSN